MYLNQNQKASNLPVFNQTISIEVFVDDIHKKLMGTFPEDYKHKEILSHAIIGGAVEHGGLSFIYNALNGYTNDVDFTVGDIVDCKSQERRKYTPSTTETKADWQWIPIGSCEVIEINMYKQTKLLVRFTHDSHDGTRKEEKTVWVDHRKCTKHANIEIVHNAH